MIRLPINTINQDTLIPTLRRYGCRALVVDETVAVKVQSFINDIFQGVCTDLKDLKNILLLNKVPKCLSISQTIETISGLAAISNDPGNVISIQNTIDPEDVAVLFPTSGSTGEPKFVNWTHLMVIKLGQSLCALQPKFDNDVVLNDRPFSWGGSNVFGPLVVRSTTVSLDSRTSTGRGSIEIIYKIIDEEKVTQALFLPYLLYDAMRAKEHNITTPACLKCIMTFGERVPSNLLEFAVKTFQYVILLYGCAETGIISGNIIAFDTHYDRGSAEMMKCFPGYEIKITGNNCRVLPRGKEGNIQIRSFNEMVGYYMNPEATKEIKSENGWIKTGDIGVMNDEGLMKITGRVKNIISKGTTKICPEVIEDILLNHPKVDEVAVIGVPDPRFFQDICACVVPKSETQPTVKELEEFIANSMIDAKLSPGYYVFMKCFPRLGTGKIDKSNLMKKTMEILDLQ